MKALLFAAGLGTRLRPLTDEKPKALVEINGKTLLQITIEKLVYFGFKDIIVNIHHFADLMIETIEKSKGWGANITISDERNELLETGGGLKKAAWFFDDNEPFLVHNVDVIHDLDLRKLYDFHLQNQALATLAIRKRVTSRYLLFNNDLQLRGWQNIKTGEVKIAKRTQGQLWSFGFSGIHIIDPKIFPLLTENGKFSIINPYLKMAKTELIQGFDHSDSVWIDVGKHESLEEAKAFLI
ncbi:MAG: nucleotidyltransferase family protein [Saprospiraceae bacterium]|nr:nucleotidyltransferase family protein [Saprospiraceae bacterium]